MKILFAVFLTLVLIFSFAVSAYISFFRIPVINPKVKSLAFLTIGLATTALTLVLCLAIVWPPVM